MTPAFNAYCDELDKLINRFRDEWDLSYAEAVGALEFVKHKLLAEAYERADEGDDDADACP